MIPYFVLLTLPIIFNKFRFKTTKKTVSITIDAFFVLFLFLLFFRKDTVGCDLINYSTMFNFIKEEKYYLLDIMREPLFSLINITIAKISLDFRVVIVISAIISIIPLAVLYKKNNDIPLLSIILFVSIAPFSLFFSGLRQVMAIGITVIAFKYVKEKKKTKFIFLILVATGFHRSALIALLLYPVYWMDINKDKLYLLVPFVMILLIFNKQIFTYITTFIADDVYSNRYILALDNGSYGMLFLFILFVIYCYFIPDSYKLTRNEIGLRNYLILALFIQCFVPISTAIMRLGYYFIIYIPILIPKIIKKSKYKKLSTISVSVMEVFFLVYFFFNAYNGADILNVFPYYFMWE